ncbi:hypothetical protein BUALT_Bualt08G0031200 [Buddleja alternifolia]|uniref:Amino acid transporter transmembrane domain-containing protein n=1 Tax=Buddleja alternifolia TaxID=168488 RepID=A0AAV6X3N5_9LAMI|nr:hypothetical protein BUALT_Bualt08G0031200 [Buddleja alternifolia]
MAKELQKNSMFIEQTRESVENSEASKNFDDDGRTVLTASAHIVTAVIGSGVLSLAWAIAQLGWVGGPAVLIIFSFITYFTSTLLADAYRSPGPVHGNRNYTYMDVVRSHLGGYKVQLCGLAQYGNLVGVTIGYTITASISMIILSQIPNFHKLSWLSIVAAVMSFAYASIGLGLSIAKNTLKSPPPENKVMKKASLAGVSTTTLFYMLCGCVGYAAFGNKAPGNFLTGFGFYEPFWLIDFANVCIAVHLIGAYQVFAQPIFGFVEKKCSQKWPENKFIITEHAVKIPLCGTLQINLFRMVWRTVYVIVTAVLAMIFPFFNDFLGLIGAASFYPLTVYFPIELHIAQAKIPKYSFTWTWLKILSWACLVVSLVAAAGSIRGLGHDVKAFKPFKTQ